MLAYFANIAIIPNIHPALVHFTIALLSISFIFQSVYYFGKTHYPQKMWIKEMEIVGRWSLWLTLFFSILTVLAGLHAYYTVPHDEDGHLAMGIHKNSAIVTFSLIIITSVLSILQFRKRCDTSLTVVILLAITQISALTTAYLGAEVVFRYGVGVIKAQTTEMMVGHNHHDHDHDHADNSDDNVHNIKDKSLSSNTKSADKIPLYWIDPMEPKVHYPKGGTSPMGMELEPVYPKDNDEELPTNSIKLPASYISNLGVKTSIVQSGTGDNSFISYANVESNETKVSFITSYANGWVRKLVAKTPQMPIKKGQLLAQIFSPTIINAENEYQSALISKNEATIIAAKNKLLTLHVDPIQINAITATTPVNQLINIYAPQNGILTSLNIREGDYITPDKQLFALTDLSSVWMIANVFEKQVSQIKVGMPVKVNISGVLGRDWSGKVDYVYPQLDDATRTIRVRVVLNNPDFVLKPGMYGSVLFNSSNKATTLLVPTQAIIMSTSENRVVVALGDGVFQVRKIIIGNEIGEMTQIISGLSSGEQVVSNGEFMLDSEASLSAGISRIDSSSPQVISSSPKTESTMSGMDMSNMKTGHSH
ncbi:MAG: efflux RND transporter periplasmic adaptor subunit [Neisseriales bacterium]|nr:MAG: efflux RND transporter periplasmic adaptor subunit [Neisseriales bacterium]